MSDAERDPHVLVSARLGKNAKLIDLPNDRARLGYVYLLGEAKLRHPAGQFPNRKVLEVDLGWYERFIGDYLTAGLIHAAPVTCDSCLEDAPQWAILAAPAIVVHDWHRHQGRSSKRVRQWRDDMGVPSGHHVLPDVSGKRTGNNGETSSSSVSPTYPSRARPRPLQSQSYVGESLPTKDLENGGVQGGFDSALWVNVTRLASELTGRPYPFGSPYGGLGAMALDLAGSVPWCDLEETFRRVAAVYRRPTGRQLIFDAEGILRPTGLAIAKPTPQERDRADAEAQLASITARRYQA